MPWGWNNRATPLLPLSPHPNRRTTLAVAKGLVIVQPKKSPVNRSEEVEGNMISHEAPEQEEEEVDGAAKGD